MVFLRFSAVIVLLFCLTSSMGKMACDPRKAKMSCIIGCLRCSESYGRHVYDMRPCCADCQISRANLIDDGPLVCSKKYLFKKRKLWASVCEDVDYWRNVGSRAIKTLLRTDICTLSDLNRIFMGIGRELQQKRLNITHRYAAL